MFGVILLYGNMLFSSSTVLLILFISEIPRYITINFSQIFLDKFLPDFSRKISEKIFN